MPQNEQIKEELLNAKRYIQHTPLLKYKAKALLKKKFF